MLTVRSDPPIEGAPEDAVPPSWTVLSNDAPVGRAWASRYSEQVTLHIQGVSIVDTSISDALARAQRHFGVAVDPLEPLAQPYECRAHEHAVRHVRYVGPLQVEICADPKCAKIALVICEHPKNTWNAEQTTLTCDFCGRDVT